MPGGDYYAEIDGRSYLSDLHKIRLCLEINDDERLFALLFRCPWTLNDFPDQSRNRLSLHLDTNTSAVSLVCSFLPPAIYRDFEWDAIILLRSNEDRLHRYILYMWFSSLLRLDNRKPKITIQSWIWSPLSFHQYYCLCFLESRAGYLRKYRGRGI